MTLTNFVEKSIIAKVLYLGPPQSGKSTTFRYLASNVEEIDDSAMIGDRSPDDSVAQGVDFVRLRLNDVQGFQFWIHMYACNPGDLDPLMARVLMRGLDACVFHLNADIAFIHDNLDCIEAARTLIQRHCEPATLLTEIFSLTK